jgi:hypothetical protein
MLMHNRCDVDAVSLHFIKDSEGETGYQSLPNVRSVDWTCIRKLLDAAHCLFNCGEEVQSETFQSSFIESVLTRSFPYALGDGKPPSSLESFSRSSKSILGINPLNFTAVKFFKSSLSFSKPQLDAISQGEFHRISGELV